jgi:hypothetical protein
VKINMSAPERIAMSFKSIYFYIINEKSRLERELELSSDNQTKVVELEVYKRLESLFNAQITEMTSVLDNEEDQS